MVSLCCQLRKKLSNVRFDIVKTCKSRFLEYVWRTISPKRCHQTQALPPSGCWVTVEYGWAWNIVNHVVSDVHDTGEAVIKWLTNYVHHKNCLSIAIAHQLRLADQGVFWGLLRQELVSPMAGYPSYELPSQVEFVTWADIPWWKWVQLLSTGVPSGLEVWHMSSTGTLRDNPFVSVTSGILSRSSVFERCEHASMLTPDCNFHHRLQVKIFTSPERHHRLQWGTREGVASRVSPR